MALGVVEITARTLERGDDGTSKHELASIGHLEERAAMSQACLWENEMLRFVS